MSTYGDGEYSIYIKMIGPYHLAISSYHDALYYIMILFGDEVGDLGIDVGYVHHSTLHIAHYVRGGDVG